MDHLIFSRPVFLWGLFGAILPVVIHLINRHRARRRKFAAMDFLFRVQKKSARRILLKQILLLIIRTLLLIFLVLAAAGPVMQARVHGDKKGPVSLALVVDCSFSMQAHRDDGSSMFDFAVEQARSMILQMGPSDSTCIFAADLENKAVVSPCINSRAKLLSGLKQLTVSWAGNDLNMAISKAAGVLEKVSGSDKKIVVLTDAAASAFSSKSIQSTTEKPIDLVIFDLAKDQKRNNRAVLDVDSIMDSGSVKLAAHLVAYGDGGQTPVEVNMGADCLARGFADLNVGQVVVKIFSIHPKTGNIHRGFVRLNNDSLAGDDEQGFYVSEKGKVRALLVNGDMRTVIYTDELFYLEHALSTTDTLSSGVAFTTITPDRLMTEILQGKDVVFLANVRHLDAQALDALVEFVAAGGGLFVAFGDRIDVDQFNQELGKVLPWKLRDVVSLSENTVGSDGEHGLPFDRIQQRHPLIIPLGSESSASLGAVRTWRAVVCEPGPGSQDKNVLIRYSNGVPALLDGRYGMGRVLLFTSSLDMDWTNWPARASFLPFLLSAARYLAGELDMSPPIRVDVGSPVQIAPGDGVEKIQVRTPAGKLVSLSRISGGSGKVVFSETSRPGWYEIIRSGKGIVHKSGMPGFFVRIPPSESNLTPITPDRLNSVLGKGANVSMESQSTADFRRVASVLLVLSLLLLLCEGVLIRH